ncbi:MAG TPA: chemotaxis protein CheX [Terriglobales bacterium]|nr:chemotaxis protein CheX [Terriglobales bacterium]
MRIMANQRSQSFLPLDPAWKSLLECAMVEVFEMMAGVRPEVIGSPEGEPRGEQMAMVGMAGALCGMTTFRCSKAMASKLASLMLGEEAASSPSSARDAVGELCNMIAGNFKSKVSSLANHCMLSVPTVITGDDYSISAVDPSEGFTIAMTLHSEIIWVTLITHV